MVAGTLYTYPENFRAYKILIAANYSGAKVKVDPSFVFGTTNKSAKFLSKFPLGKVPAFESDDKTVNLTESNAIAFYVSNKQLTGADHLAQSSILQWLSFADLEILPASCAWVFPVLGILPYDKKASERAIEDVKAALDVLESHLQKRTYLVGERITLADICVACTLLHLYQNVMDPQFRKKFVSVNRWFNTIINQPEVKSVIGEVKLCDQVAKVDPKKYEKFQKETGGSAKGKPAANTESSGKGKPAGTTEGSAKVATEDSTEGEAKNKPEELPKSSFDMDSFKRFYSNEDTDKSIPHFWEKFDPECFSIWFSEYKYPNELQKVFMSCNLITGMFQRLDKMRKVAFASVCLFGGDGNSTISGVWVWRGHDLIFKTSPDWQVDYESYDWTKLDPKDPKTKALVQQYFNWEGKDKSGRPFNQGKIFK